MITWSKCWTTVKISTAALWHKPEGGSPWLSTALKFKVWLVFYILKAKAASFTQDILSQKGFTQWLAVFCQKKAMLSLEVFGMECYNFFVCMFAALWRSIVALKKNFLHARLSTLTIHKLPKLVGNLVAFAWIGNDRSGFVTIPVDTMRKFSVVSFSPINESE